MPLLFSDAWKDTGVYMSVDHILQKIIADANRDAEALLQSAKNTASVRAAAILETGKQQVKEIEKNAEADAAEITRRRMLAASLDARKNSLSRRRELLDQAFSAALDAYCSLPQAEYKALVVKLIANASETGHEKVYAPGQDEKYYTGEASLLAEANAALKKAGKTGALCFGGALPGLRGGVMLSGDIADIDCSFESLVAQFREEHEMDVAKILFEGEV